MLQKHLVKENTQSQLCRALQKEHEIPAAHYFQSHKYDHLHATKIQEQTQA